MYYKSQPDGVNEAYRGQPHAQAVDAYGQPIMHGEPHGGQNVQMGQVTAMKPTATVTTGWRDWPFALLFFMNVTAMVVLCFLWGVPSIKGESTFSFITEKQMKYGVALSGVLSVIAAVMAMVILQLLVRYARVMITVSLWFGVVMSFVFIAYALYIESYVLAIIAAIFALLNLWYDDEHRILRTYVDTKCLTY
jgi:hypothetical protein